MWWLLLPLLPLVAAEDCAVARELAAEAAPAVGLVQTFLSYRLREARLPAPDVDTNWTLDRRALSKACLAAGSRWSKLEPVYNHAKNELYQAKTF